MPIPDRKAPRKPVTAPRTAGDANVALLLTWLVPGAGHLYLGRARTALVAFVGIQGLYLLGIWLSAGMLLEYLPLEMRGRFAGVLTPVVGNLGALLFQINRFGYGDGVPRAWPAMMDLGTTLTALSGVLNLFLMSSAHLEARLPDRPRGRGIEPPPAALATFLVPGLGQVLQGRRVRGVVMFVLLVGLFLLGCWLAQGSNLDRERHFYYWAGQFLLGLPASVAEFVHGHSRITAEVPYADAGVVIACVAGMLNVLCMLDAFSYGEERLLHAEPSPRSREAGAVEAAMTGTGAVTGDGGGTSA